MEKSKSDSVDSKILILFFLEKLFEENEIDTDTYVIAKKKVMEGKKDVTKK